MISFQYIYWYLDLDLDQLGEEVDLGHLANQFGASQIQHPADPDATSAPPTLKRKDRSEMSSDEGREKSPPKKTLGKSHFLLHTE